VWLLPGNSGAGPELVLCVLLLNHTATAPAASTTATSDTVTPISMPWVPAEAASSVSSKFSSVTSAVDVIEAGAVNSAWGEAAVVVEEILTTLDVEEVVGAVGAILIVVDGNGGVADIVFIDVGIVGVF